MPRDISLLNELFVSHYMELVAWCRRRVPPHVCDPEDLVHLAYMRCQRRWSYQRRSRANQVAYLYRALRWVMLDALRDQRRWGTTGWLPADCSCRHDSPCRRLIALEAVADLPRRQREICMAILRGQSLEEIQADLGLSKGALAVALCRAKHVLSQDGFALD